jgi:hypothetical protein
MLGSFGSPSVPEVNYLPFSGSMNGVVAVEGATAEYRPLPSEVVAVSDFAVDPWGPQHLVAIIVVGGADAVVESTDGGRSWRTVVRAARPIGGEPYYRGIGILDSGAIVLLELDGTVTTAGQRAVDGSYTALRMAYSANGGSAILLAREGRIEVLQAGGLDLLDAGPVAIQSVGSFKNVWATVLVDGSFHVGVLN